MKLSLYDIRQCKKDEYPKLVSFFRDYWGENHVFCRNKEIFEFQHGDAENGEYDFIIAIHNRTNEIHAVLGFISFSRYDGRDPENPICVSGALWKVRNDIKNKEIGKLGLGVLYFLLKRFPQASYITLGLSKYSQDIYQALHFDFGIMDHYYIASKHVEEYKIAMHPIVNQDVDSNFECELLDIEGVPSGFDSYFYPTKSVAYINNRYLKHPFYVYKLIGVYKNEELLSIWVTREIEVGGHKCVRIVDIVGNMSRIPNIEGNVNEFLKLRDAEYIDCYCHGIDNYVFESMGFKRVCGNVIIPNFFEPFERKNVDIHYAALSPKPVVIFKGDCDQDRPNLLGQ